MLARYARLVRLALVLLLGGVGVGLCLAALVPGARLLASTSRVDKKLTLRALDERTTVYDVNGDVIATLGLTDRAPVTLSEVPTVLVNAVVAVEDRTFWDNPGVDVQALVRAAIANVDKGGIEQGGSTISQQLVKTRVLTKKRDLHRKVREAILAVRLNEQYSKTEILQEYLNTVYFGQGAYGVQAAAERFFRFKGLDGNVYETKLEDLDVPQAALLAGLVSNPEGNNPFTNPEGARKRRAEALHAMVKEGYITPEAEAQANLAPLPSIRPPADLRPDNYFVEEVQRRLLADPRLGATDRERSDKVLRGGLQVYTTYDPKAQAAAQAAVSDIVPDQPPFTAALAAIDPSNGEVRAIVGGPNFKEVQYNLATQGARQPGSTFKAITLTALLENGFTPDDIVDGTSPCTVVSPGFPPYDTANAEPGGGVMTIRQATVGSVNCAYARLIVALGPKKVADMAKRLGIQHDVPAYPSITLGTSESTPLEMATVFATLANDGVEHDPVFVRKVVDASGKTLFEGHSPGRQAVDPEIARMVNDILQGVVARGTGTRARLDDGREQAGKTGTTDEKTDAWFCGYVPQLSACVWMGAPTGRVPMTNVGGITVFGGTYPARVWKAFAESELAGVEPVDFTPPTRSFGEPGAVTDQGRISRQQLQDYIDSTTTTTSTVPPASTTTTSPSSTTTAPTTTTTAPAPTTTAPAQPPGRDRGGGR